MSKPNSRTLDKALDLLIALGVDGGRQSFADIAETVGIPFSTARRFGAVFESRQLIVRQKAGRYLPGPALLEMAEGMPRRSVFVAMARPVLMTLSRNLGMTAHLGVLEDQMVTYLCKASAECTPLFTREGMQLEAYCSGIGKVLLAAMADDELGRYLAGGSLVALTPNTIIDPDELRTELALVRTNGWAMEDGEVVPGLACLATPVTDASGLIWAAISVSGERRRFDARTQARQLASLKAAADTLARLPVTLSPSGAEACAAPSPE